MEFGPSVKLTKRNHRALPILDYYLTFIHYFGFGINPTDDHSSRYLSIRVKRAPQKSIYERDQWLASYTRRTQRKLNSLPIPIFAYLKITMKYLAISLITFITVNHCFVLADYVYQGSRGIEEIILDVRLVITKLSALIFVLSWHHKRAEVRQLIKLVKSTSLYILATHGQQQRQQQPPNGLLLAADASPIPSPTPTTAAAAAEAGCTNDAAAGPTTSNLDGANGGKLTATISDEIGSSLRLDTRAFDRRILKGWLCCLLIIVVHFSLSEAEISKSHHLWQWLDDYSLHQLNNQSISYETLMSLATFDNYIYTVHVYGTRLIGASIICIVCSLQHEVIKSLNLYTLRLIKRSKQPLLTSFGEQAGGPVCALNQAADDSDEDSHEHGCGRRRRRRRPSASSSRISLMSGWDEHRAHASCGCRDAKSPLVDASAFFVLGESDWFRVRANRNHLEPPGHLSACVWQLRQLLLHQLASLVGPAVRPLKSRISKWLAREQRKPDDGRSFGAASPLAKPFDSATRINLNGSANNRVTPKNDNSSSERQPASSTFEQVASSLIRMNAVQPAAGGAASRRRRAATGLLLRPTPLMTASAAATAIFPSSARAVGAPMKDGRTDLMAAPSLLPPPLRLAHANLAFATAAATTASHQPLLTRHHWAQKFGGESTALHGLSPLRSSDEYHARLMAICGRVGQLEASAASQPTVEAAAAAPPPPPANGARNIELQLERLSTKYELVRTVNARIDACFGPMLLIQFFFLFLMSCIDLVFFSLCFSASTKTKYIIISGMILLWCPYMLIYKFASDMGSSSKELLVSIRRLARLYLIEDQAVSASQASGGRATSGGGTVIGTGCRGDGRAHQQQLRQQHHLWSTTSRLETTNNSSNGSGSGMANYNCRLMTLSSPFIVAQSDLAATKIGAAIVDKLDHVFKPTHLSIMGIMTVDKFFLLNFAKIVITSSVMMIQFISN